MEAPFERGQGPEEVVDGVKVFFETVLPPDEAVRKLVSVLFSERRTCEVLRYVFLRSWERAGLCFFFVNMSENEFQEAACTP
jgi:hypothetical protein